jgi:Mn-containing catalase
MSLLALERTKKTLLHLLTRELTHATMFMVALDQMGKLDNPLFGTVPPDATVNLVFNLSQGEDVRGPWNEELFEYIADVQPMGGMPPAPVNPDDEKPEAVVKAKANRRSARR